MKHLIEHLESLPSTVLSGVCLAVSLLFSNLGVALPFNLAWVAVAVSGLPLVYTAIRKLVHHHGITKISSALLISIAMVAAVAIGDVFAAGEVAFIMAIGEWLEEKTTRLAKQGLHRLLELTPTTGRRLTATGTETISAAEIHVGDILRVLPGETIPVDGEIVAGNTSIDQSVMTGESLPVDKAEGDTVFGGTVNRFGVVDIRATRVGEDSSLQQLIRLVEQAERNQAPVQRIADVWASWLVPVALVLAALAGLLTRDITVAVTVLVVFCPCALVLATPTAIMAAVGQATRRGIIIKSGAALELFGKATVVAFDKTGTLTTGQLTVSDILPLEEHLSRARLLALAAGAESRSEHPLAAPITALAATQQLPVPPCEEFCMVAGRGVRATVDGQPLLCGSEQYLRNNNIPLSPHAEQALAAFRAQGKATVLVARPYGVLGILALSDSVKPAAINTVHQLTEQGMTSLLLTGDHPQAAETVAHTLGLSAVHANLLPKDKVACIRALQQSGHTVCMVGDGINDAPALKTADIGIAMGTMGSDIAIDAADIALVGDDLSALPYLKRLAVATMRTVKGGIALSLGINLVAILLSFFKLLNPITGALVHNAGACLVVLIAARLYHRSFD